MFTTRECIFGTAKCGGVEGFLFTTNMYTCFHHPRRKSPQKFLSTHLTNMGVSQKIPDVQAKTATAAKLAAQQGMRQGVKVKDLLID